MKNKIGKEDPSQTLLLRSGFKIYLETNNKINQKKKKNNMILMLSDGIGGAEKEREKQRQKHRDTQREKDKKL